jgi:tetratricopeptide (TPR) repeat protein
MKLGKWNEAMASFETCYRDFPNAEDAVGRENPFHKTALLKWAEAAVSAQNWELAISQYRKFLAERDKQRDTYPQGPFHIAMAICHFKLGLIPEGGEHLEIAIRNKTSFPTAETAIIAGFQELVLACIAKPDEQALLDFITKNRGELVTEPFVMQHYAPVFMKLAGDAMAVGLDRAAITLYQCVPSTDAAIDDIRARLKSIGPLTRVTDGANILLREKLEAALAALDEQRRGKRSPEMTRLAAAAYLHERNGNVRGALAAYLQLESFHPNSEKREENLFNLVRTSSMVGEAADTQRHAETFLKTFPNSKHLPAIQRVMLSVLFYDGRYEECIEVATPLLDKLKPGGPEHDICLHTLGGSYFYTGQYQKAAPLLDQHVEQYPKSHFAVAAAYFRAANQSRLLNWSRSAALLDEFLKAYPDPSKNAFLPFALYDRANCHYAEEQPEDALARISALIKDFPDAIVIAQAYLLRGNIEQSLKNDDRAEQAFASALDNAVKRGQKGVAGEALYSLVLLLGQPDNPRIREAVPFADRFWEEFAADSPLKPRFAVAQFAALDAAGRTDDGLARMRDAISEAAGQPEAVGLEELINSYTEAYLTKHTPEQLKEHYYNFPGIRSTDSAARALLRVAVIGVFEGVVKKTTDDAVRRSGNAMIKVLFQELKTDFALKDLTNFILVKVGDFLRTNTATPREALPYYNEALGRENQTGRFSALLGRADVFGNSAAAADIDKALADFETVYNESEEKSEREFSLFRIIELLMARKEYATAAEKARIYLDREKTGFSKYSATAGLLLARSFEERGMRDDAISMYVKVWSAHMGNIKVSAPAMKSWMQLSWERNKPAAGPAAPADRQGAYEGGARYIELTGRFKSQMVESDLALWQEVEKLVLTYEANPAIKSMAQIKAEKEAAGKSRMRN